MVKAIPHSAPQYNATRRIKLLFAATVIATLGCIGGWFYVANMIDTHVGHAITDARVNGTIARCDNQAVRGFPFRFGLFCDATSLSKSDVSVTGGALRSAAQFYNPNHVIIELDAPLAIQTRQTTAQLNWASARASLVYAGPLPRRLSVEMSEPNLKANRWPAMSSESIAIHMRVPDDMAENGSAPGDVDMVVRISRPALAALLNSAAELDVDLEADVTLKQLATRYKSGERRRLVQNAEMTIHRLAILLSQDSGILADGQLTTDVRGQISGTLDIRIIDINAVATTLRSALPDHTTLITMLESLPRAGDNNDEATLSLRAVNGQLFFGFIPLGTLPALN